MLELQTINDIFTRIAQRGEKAVAQTQEGDNWQSVSGRQFYGRVRALVQALRQWGIQEGDRIAILGENRIEWPISDFATLALGAVNVPIYQTTPPEQIAYILKDSGSKAILLSTSKQLDKLRQAGSVDTLEHVAVWDEGTFEGADSFRTLLASAAELEGEDDSFERLLKQAKAEDLATIIYTSGTTGDPKGVMLTHGNLASNLKYSTDDLGFQESDSSISFLPLSHALARHQDYALYARGVLISYLPEFNGLAAAMKQVKPTILVGVPRVFEKAKQGVEGHVHGLKKVLFDLSLKEGASHRDETAAGEHPHGIAYAAADKLAFQPIRDAFGGQVKVFISGGSPLGQETTEWFLSVGIRIFEGYGLTETSPVIARNTTKEYRPGTVGKVLENVEVRTAQDGELEVRGPSVFGGYWQNPEGTKKEFTEDGWFKTGDIGKLEDGFLTITDRKKELLKTSGGKYVAPQPIENKLKADPLVGQVALIGDNRKFVSAIISPQFEELEKWAKQNGVSATDHADLANNGKVHEVYQRAVDEVNKGLGHHETIKKFIVVPEEWSVESGDLTPSLKLKRRVVVDKYKEQVDSLYAETAE